MGRRPAPSDPPTFYQHVGLYAYRREFLLQLAAMPPSPLEQIEKLEQLRVLEAGYPILVGVIDEPTFGIDTPEDYRAFVEKQLRAHCRVAKACRGLTAPGTCVDCGHTLRGLLAPGYSCRFATSLRRLQWQEILWSVNRDEDARHGCAYRWRRRCCGRRGGCRPLSWTPRSFRC